MVVPLLITMSASSCLFRTLSECVVSVTNEKSKILDILADIINFI